MEGSEQLVSFEAAPVSGHGWVVVEGAGKAFLAEPCQVVLNSLVYAGGCGPMVLKVDLSLVAWNLGALPISCEQVS